MVIPGAFAPLFIVFSAIVHLGIALFLGCAFVIPVIFLRREAFSPERALFFALAPPLLAAGPDLVAMFLCLVALVVWIVFLSDVRGGPYMSTVLFLQDAALYSMPAIWPLGIGLGLAGVVATRRAARTAN